jgi:hypothetical protein
VSFLSIWWSDIAEMTFDSNSLDNLNTVYETEVSRLGRVLKRLVNNNIPFISVLISNMLKSGKYGNISGLWNELFSEYTSVDKRYGNKNAETPKQHVQVMGDALTQNCLDSDISVCLEWLNRLSKSVTTEDNYMSYVVTWIGIEPIIFSYKNFNLKSFDNINEELLISLRNNGPSKNFVDLFVELACVAIDCFVNEDSDRDDNIEIPPVFNKYLNYMKLKGKIKR